MLVAVTGASGHVGGSLVRALLDRGDRVRAVDLRAGPGLDRLDVEFVAADVHNRPALEEAFTGTDVVFHLAAKISAAGDPDGSVWSTNVAGARNAAEAALAADVRRFVHTSSVHSFDLERCDEVEETSVRAEAEHLPIYDRSKWAGEQEVQRVIGRGLDGVIVNPTGIIGPLDFGPSRMGAVLLGLRDNRFRFVVPGGFDWVDVRDVAAGLIAAADHGRTGENYLLSGHHQSVRGLAEIALREAEIDAEPVTVPMWLARGWGPFGTVIARRTGSPWALTTESLHALANDPPVNRSKAGREFDYRPRPTTETVRDVYAWFDRSE